MCLLDEMMTHFRDFTGESMTWGAGLDNGVRFCHIDFPAVPIVMMTIIRGRQKWTAEGIP